MYLFRVAAFVAVVGPALGAQQAAQQTVAQAATTASGSAAQPGALSAEVRYTDNGDAWFTSNKPAYVALFDVTRNGLAQLYPVFSAQATELSDTSGRFDLRAHAPLPTVAVFGASSLVPLSAGPAYANASGWPHTLLLIASTSPLRVGSSWSSNIALNNDLVREHHWNDVDSDAGISAIVELVRPDDRTAEVVFDRAESATPVRYAASLAYDPNKVALAYSCEDGTKTFISPTAVLGANCVGVRDLPATAPGSARVTAPAGVSDTAGSQASTSRAHNAGASSAAASATRNVDVQSISDPADIRRFIESMKGQMGDGTPPGEVKDGRTAAGEPANANRRAADGTVSSRLTGVPPANSGERHAGATAAQPAPSHASARGVSTATAAPSSPPIKPE